MNEVRLTVAHLLRRILPPACGLLALAAPAAAQGTWQRIGPVSGGSPLAAVAIPAADVAIAVSPDMRIIRSTDGGLNWSERDPNMPWALDRGLYGVAFTDANTGVAVGNSYAVTRTTDGGLTWTYIPLVFSASERLRNPVFRGDVITIVNFGIVRSTDRGNEWTGIPFLDEGNLNDISVIDDSTIIGVGPMGVTGAGTILKSIDSGRTWQWIYSPQDGFRTFTAIAFSGQNGAVVGHEGAIYNTTDGGGSWSRAHGGQTYDLMDVAYADHSTALAVGTGGTILRSTDGGKSWSGESSPVTVTLRGIATRGSLAIAVGDSGVVVRNASAAAVDRGYGEALDVSLRVAPNPSRGDVVISYRLGERSHVRVSIVDVLGREVRVLREGAADPGACEIPSAGMGLPAGRYSVRMEIDGRVQVLPMVIAK